MHQCAIANIVERMEANRGCIPGCAKAYGLARTLRDHHGTPLLHIAGSETLRCLDHNQLREVGIQTDELNATVCTHSQPHILVTWRSAIRH